MSHLLARLQLLSDPARAGELRWGGRLQVLAERARALHHARQAALLRLRHDADVQQHADEGALQRDGLHKREHRRREHRQHEALVADGQRGTRREEGERRTVVKFDMTKKPATDRTRRPFIM